MLLFLCSLVLYLICLDLNVMRVSKTLQRRHFRTRISEVKQNFMSDVPAADCHPNYFDMSPSYWKIYSQLAVQRRASLRRVCINLPIIFQPRNVKCQLAKIFNTCPFFRCRAVVKNISIKKLQLRCYLSLALFARCGCRCCFV